MLSAAITQDVQASRLPPPAADQSRRIGDSQSQIDSYL
jgi:hypothetical protein